MPRNEHSKELPKKPLPKPAALGKKRAVSPSEDEQRPPAPVKRLKPFVLHTSPTRPAASSLGSNHDASSQSMIRPPKNTVPVSSDPFMDGLSMPHGSASPTRTTITSISVADPFIAINVPPGSATRPSIVKSAGASAGDSSGELLARIGRVVSSQLVVGAPGPAVERRNKRSIQEANEISVLVDSPSKKSKVASGSSLPVPKASLIPKRVASSSSAAPQSKITAFFHVPAGSGGSSTALPPPATTPLHSSVASSTGGNAPSTSLKAQKSFPPRSPSKSLPHPSKRSVSSSTAPVFTDVPSRPGTSLGFSERSTLHTSTQTSLSNLTSALEKLAMPRIRASLGGGASSEIAGSSTPGASTSVPPKPLRSAGTGVHRPLARASSAIVTRPGAGSMASGGMLRRSTGPGAGPYAQIGRGRPSGTTAGIPARRTLSAMGPPPARSASAALAARAETVFQAAALSGPIEEAQTPLDATVVASSPGTTAAIGLTSPEQAGPSTSREQRNRRASIASRSLADETMMMPEANDSTVISPGAEVGASGEKKKAKKLTILKDCVIYVDVKTDDGADAGELFVNMLKGLGARIISRLTPSITHIVFKSGSPTTLSKHKLYNDPKPFMVGIGWVVECTEKREKVDEARFIVDELEPVVTGGKRRKSMVPAFDISGPSNLFPGTMGPSSLPSMAEEEEEESQEPSIRLSFSKPSIANSLPPLERARQRSSAYAPKVSSPLKATFKPVEVDSDEEEINNI